MVKCERCGNLIDRRHVVISQGRWLCPTCFVEVCRGDIEAKLGVTIGLKSFDEICPDCGTKMSWWSEVKFGTRYTYLRCEKCGKRITHVSRR